MTETTARAVFLSVAVPMCLMMLFGCRDESKEVEDFSKACLTEHHGDGDLCGLIWRAKHPVGRGY